MRNEPVIFNTLDIDYDALEDIEEAITAKGWTDGLPVHVPTVERVEKFLDASGMNPEEIIGHVAPSGGLATMRLIAINAVMAGCKPEHLPVVAAGVKAIIEPAFNLYKAQVTTNPVTPFLVVNGPARRNANVSWGRDALGPGNTGNGPIGRALRLVMRNVGGIGDLDTSTHGSPLKYTCCLAEDEEGSPWEPLHVWEGYDREDSVVTAIGVEGIIDIVPESGTTNAPNLLNHFSHAIQTISTGTWWSRGNPAFVMPSRYCALFHDAGMTRHDVQVELFERSKLPRSHLPFDNINTGQWTMDGDRILMTEKPEDIYLIVSGSPEGHHALYMVPCGSLVKATHAKVSADWKPAGR